MRDKKTQNVKTLKRIPYSRLEMEITREERIKEKQTRNCTVSVKVDLCKKNLSKRNRPRNCMASVKLDLKGSTIFELHTIKSN